MSYTPKTTSRYTKTFDNPQGPGDARPTALDIVKDEGLEGKLGDKVVLITGCSSGIGIETARAIAATGAKLFLGVRNTEKGEAALKDILKPGHIELLKMDLNSLDSIRSAASHLLTQTPTLNILINNAGIMALPTRTLTADGFEAQFGTNHLAHFLLFQLLKPTLLHSSTPTFPSRVICLSSLGHRTHGLYTPDYNLTAPNAYTPWGAYGQSKTANIYMANEIERRYGAKGLHGLSVHPGGIMTGLQTHVDDGMKKVWDSPEAQKVFKSTEQGAATTVFAALAKELEGKGGVYLEDCNVAGPKVEEGVGVPGYAPHAYDEEGEKRLWVDSCGMVGVSGED